MFLDRTVFIRKGRRARRKTVSTYANRETVSHLRTAELLSVISIREFTWNAQQVSALTYRSFECYIPLDVGYLLLTLPITLWIDSNGVESRRQLSL
jgi:ABC-type amino acid transport system permease subunit